MIYIGIDASLRSTGITIIEEKQTSFYIITRKATKKQKSSPHYTALEYRDITGDLTASLYNYIDCLRSLVKSKICAHYDEVTVALEAPILAGNSRCLVDFGILSGFIRCMIHDLGIKLIMVNNMTWKKELLGNGGADKDLTCYYFKALQPQFKSNSTKEISDIADSFFIAQYARQK